MATPPLPPPPGAQGWAVVPPPAAAPRGSALQDRPAWRQGRPGWALLHVVIAFAIAFGAFFVAVLFGMIGRTEAQMNDADDGPVAIGSLLVLGASVVAWFLFAYIDRPLGQRWILFGLLVGGSIAVAAILFSVASA
jgi:hypothetical protein